MSATSSGTLPPPPPTAPPPTAPSSLEYRVPPLGIRIAGGTVRFVILVIVLVVIPVAALDVLHSLSIALPIPVETEAFYGVLLSALLAARYVVRPTRAYGPVSMAAALVSILFLITLLLQPPYSLAVPQTPVTITIGFEAILLLLLLIPVLTLAAGAVTTVEDLRSPGERLEFDFPG